MKSKKAKTYRKYVQLFFFALIGLIAVNHTLVESGAGIPFISDASLHALCPFGGVVTLYNLFTLGTFISKIHMSSVILMAIVFILAVLFGPVFCSFVCPLGTLQEWIGKIGKKIFKNRYNRFIPAPVHRVLSYFRYIVLAMVVYITAKSGYLMFADVDPYNALFSFWSDEVSVKALIVLGVLAVGSLFVERPWCKYACPYGALLGLSNKIKFFKIRRNASTCISCHQCTSACPMNIDVESTSSVTNLQCISCFECTSEAACPVENTVNLQIGDFSQK
jgi:polyferredoxin